MPGRPLNPRAAAVASVAVFVGEVLGTLLMYAPMQVGWFWVGARVYEATGSVLADLVVVLGGFLITTVLVMKALVRLDAVWIELRRRAGHEQREGALTRVVSASATVGMAAFWVWFHILEKAFVIPFMPTQ